MNKLKRISFENLLVALCILLCALSLYSIFQSNYILVYVLFIISFAALTIGYFVLNKLTLYKMLFFFIPLSLTVSIIGEAQIQLPTEPMIGLLSILLIAYWIKLKNEFTVLFKNPIVIILFIELAWMIVSSITSELVIVSFKYTFVRFCYISTFFLLGYFWLKKEKKPHQFFILYGLGLILPIINGLVFHAKFDFAQRAAYPMPQPFFNDHTVYGACIAYIIPALIIIFHSKELLPKPSHRILLLILLALLFVAEFFSYSRAAWISLMGSLLLYLLIVFKMSGKTFILSILFLSVVATLNYDTLQKMVEENKAISNKEDLGQQLKSITNIKTDVSNIERVNRWKCAIRMGNAKPIFGFGPRTYKFYYGGFQTREDLTYTSTFNGNKGHSHSDYLSYLAENGYPGFIIHILLYLIIIYQSLNTIRTCISKQNRTLALIGLLSLITYIIHGMFNGFMEDEKMASLVYMSMAMIVFAQLNEKELKEKQETTTTI